MKSRADFDGDSAQFGFFQNRNESFQVFGGAGKDALFVGVLVGQNGFGSTLFENFFYSLHRALNGHHSPQIVTLRGHEAPAFARESYQTLAIDNPGGI